MMCVVRTLTLALFLCTASALRIAPTQKDVELERTKLEKMSIMLGNLLGGSNLSHSKVAPALKLFASNLEEVLNSTRTMKPQDAMKKLQAARDGVKGLVGEMTKTQQTLMKEDFEQRESLLMGVLMTHQHDSIMQQMDILKADEFAGLDVSKELLRSNDTKTPLYLQAATFLDSHKDAAGVLSNTSINHAAHAESLAVSLERRAATLEKEFQAKDAHHKKQIAELSKDASKGGKEAKVVKATIKREERRYKKWAAMQKHDIDSMKMAADAVRKGDVKALNRARAALQASLDSLKDKNSGIVVFLQQGNALLEQDCPYCAAQCVEKCHNNGRPYVACLGECADAGK